MSARRPPERRRARRRWRALVTQAFLMACLTGLSACRDEEPPASQADPETRLVVEVRPEGADGPLERHVVTSSPPDLTPEDFAPVPRDVACAEIYGGPQRARVTGVLEGEPIDATFNRINACEMRRWDRVVERLT